MINKFIYNIKYRIKFIIYKNITKRFVYPKVPSMESTLNYIIKNKSSVSRYGDGELYLMNQKGKVGFQRVDADLSERLVEVYKSELSNHIVAIPDIFNGLDKYIKRTRYIWMSFLIKNHKDWNNFLLMDKEYHNAFITRPYYIFKDKSKSGNYFSKWKEVWHDRDIVIIEGDKSRLGVGNDLFDNAKSLQRITCPSENAFSKYDDILFEANKLDKSRLILIALGPTATVLAHDLHKDGYQAIDIGHIDIEYEWYLLQATQKVKIKNKYINEVTDGNNVLDINDEEYLNQIIKRII